MKIRFHTNLDLAKNFVYYQTDYHNRTPWEHVPPVGSCITFSLKDYGKGNETFALEVVAVTYSADGQECTVELHIPKGHFAQSIAEWEKWMNRRMGKEY